MSRGSARPKEMRFFVFFGVIVFAGGMVGGRLLKSSAPSTTDISMPSSTADAQTWHEVIQPHPQLLLVYVGRSDCPWCNDLRLPGLWASYRESILEVVDEYNSDLVEVGIAVDRDFRLGMAHLERIGTFDQISVGGGWGNVAVLNWLFDRYGGPYSTPQVLLISRWWTYSGVPPALRDSERPQLLARLSGLYDLASPEMRTTSLVAARDVLAAGSALDRMGGEPAAAGRPKK